MHTFARDLGRPSARRARTALAAVLLSSALGCGATISVPAADATAPTAGMDVLIGSRLISVTNVAQRLDNITAHDSLKLQAVGEDTDGAIRSVAIAGEIRVICGNIFLGSTVASASVEPVHTQHMQNGGPGTRVATRLYAQDTIVPAALFERCAPGATFRSAIGRVSATASNFHGGAAASETFIFTLTPLLRVGTFNIFGENDSPVKRDRVSAIISETDVVLLQEVRDSNQAAALATRSGLTFHTFANGKAILSRHLLRNISHHPIPNSSQARSVLAASADIAGIPIRFFNIHFTNKAAGASRQDQRILEATYTASLLQGSGESIILGGDLNAGTGVREYDILTSVLRDAIPGNFAPTHCARPDRADHLFYRGRITVAAFECDAQYLPMVSAAAWDSTVSDHPFFWFALVRSK